MRPNRDSWRLVLIGRSLSHYRIASALGAGGMGEVFRATDTKLGRDVALKVLPADMARDAERLARFQREARAVAALNHPNIVTIFSVEEADGIHFLTMELVEGKSLDRLIPSGGLPADKIIEMAQSLSGALAAAHDKGIIHRDLKPANVMVTGDGRVKVLDFGLAKETRETSHADATLTSASNTKAGVVMGTPAYMSPEQIAGRAVDQRTDIFSLGIVLYEMATGRRPFEGQSPAELASSILRDTPALVTEARADLPADLARIIRRCLEKNIADRFPSAQELRNELRAVTGEAGSSRAAAGTAAHAASRGDSGAARADEGFWVAVLPFKCRGGSADLTALAEGLSEEIVTGLSRFSYLRVIARSSTLRYADEAADIRPVARELGARYVMEGSLRLVGSRLRVAVQLVDATSGANLWAETYDRSFTPESVFELQDDLVPRIVSTVADQDGILPLSMSEAIRNKSEDALTPHEALLRSFGFFKRFTREEHATVRRVLESAVRAAPGNSACWALLSHIYTNEYWSEFDAQPDSLDRALAAARRAVDSAPSNALAYWALALALFMRRDFGEFRLAADRAIELNRLDGSTVAFMGHLIAYSGEWDRGRAIAEPASALNPNHAPWHRVMAFYDDYRQGEYRKALTAALRLNTPGQSHFIAARVAAYGQLGERENAQRALKELLAAGPDIAASLRAAYNKFLPPELVEKLMDGLRKAGLPVPDIRPFVEVMPSPGRDPAAAQAAARKADPGGAAAIAVLPFADMSPAQDQQYLCEGMAEEIMNALVSVRSIRVASRTSAFRAREQGSDLAAIARALGVGHVLEGSVRTAGGRLRVTAQLTDVASGYQLWSERYDREAADLFAVQDEIAAGVVKAVKSRLASGVQQIRHRPQVRNAEAYRAFLKGQHLRFTMEDIAGARLAFEEAIRLDPSHAPSWIGIAELIVISAIYNQIPAHEAYATAKKYLTTAAGLEAETADSVYVTGLVAYGERNWPLWETSMRHALDLQPNHIRALSVFGAVLCMRQRSGEAMDYFERACQADPLAAYPYAMAGVGRVAVRRPQESLRYFEDALSIEKDHTIALWGYCMAKFSLGFLEEAIAAAERGVAASRRGAFFVGLLGCTLAAAGRTSEARALLQELNARPPGAPTVVSKAWLLAALGENDAAFEVIFRAEQESQTFVCFTGYPGFDPLRNDPRFAELLKKLDYPARQSS